MNTAAPLHLTIGIDPGASGAIVVLADGQPFEFIDMPTAARKAGGERVEPGILAARLRGVLQKAQGAAVLVALEQVSAMPNQGVSSMFRFGQADGMVRGVIGALGLALVEISPASWKKRAGLTGMDKDAARALALQLFPAAEPHLRRKKDVGRADALLIARHAYKAEQQGGM